MYFLKKIMKYEFKQHLKKKNVYIEAHHPSIVKKNAVQYSLPKVGDCIY